MRLLALLALAASTVQAQKVVVKVPDSLIINDTAAVTGTVYNAAGARSTTSKVTWAVHPSERALVKPDSTAKGQKASVIARTVGYAWLVASWKRTTDGKVFSDSGRTHITVARVRPFYAAHLLPTGLVLDTTITLQIGQKVCLYVAALDRHGAYLSGIPIDEIRSLNPAIATVGGDPFGLPGPCPTTTVNPFQINAPNLSTRIG
ncbi:MAG TPA: hypothetical protein VL333_13125 [Candidatus Saccharimonadales bacterium]|jgi:hypothetical protein|nr:hypothetical protein [Candidatus Saccharimonadales bacterium]